MNQNYLNPLIAFQNEMFIMTLQVTLSFLVLITFYSYFNSVYFSYPDPFSNIPKWLIREHISKKSCYADNIDNSSKDTDVEAILSRNEAKDSETYVINQCITSCIRKYNEEEKAELVNAYVDYLQYEIRKLRTELLSNIALVNTPADTTTLTSMSPSQTDDSMEYEDAVEGKLSSFSHTGSLRKTPPILLEHEHTVNHIPQNNTHPSIEYHEEGGNPLNTPSSNPLIYNITHQVENMLDDINAISECVEGNIFHSQDYTQEENVEDFI